mmetsp:Transcript_12343/g.21636  ORF Transcript_12343/g.21636 Transcript_12343/m.21636 type:complete len:571 (-) Transcript_12343:218-1930(-)
MTPLLSAIPTFAPSMSTATMATTTNFPIVSASDTDGGGGLDGMTHQKKRAKRGGIATAAEQVNQVATETMTTDASNNHFHTSDYHNATLLADGDLFSHSADGETADHPFTEEEKLQHNRERNREHAKNTRLRKKAYVERLEISVDDLCRERDTLLSDRAASAQLLVEIHSKRVDVLRSFFALRASYSVDQKRELWSGILDESSFTCRLPVTPYQSFPSSEVQVSNCQRTICGVDGMIGDAAANYVFLNSMVDRSKYPNGRMKFQYTLVTEDSPSGGGGGGGGGGAGNTNNHLMARWSMSTLNAKKLGTGNTTELSQRGMLLCKFNSAHKIVSIEIMFDVMAFMLQVKMAMGFDNFNDVVIPNTVQTCCSQGRQYDYPMVMTLANRPYTIVQVNERWENLTGYSRDEVVGKKSCSILQWQGPNTATMTQQQQRGSDGELDRLMGPVLFQRPSCAMLTNYTKSGRRYRQYVTIYPLSTDSNISHYFGLTMFVQWMDTGPASAAATADVDAESKDLQSSMVEFSVPLTTLNPPLKETLATASAAAHGIHVLEDSTVKKNTSADGKMKEAPAGA